MRFLLLFVFILPVIDLAFLGHFIGFWNTLLVVLGTGFLGVALIRHQGLKALAEGQQKWQAGQLPVSELTTGIFLLVAGLLFFHPGIVTDTLALLCLIPGVRQLLAGYLLVRGYNAMQQRGFAAGGPMPGAQSRDDGDIIEGDFERASDEDRRRIDR